MKRTIAGKANVTVVCTLSTLLAGGCGSTDQHERPRNADTDLSAPDDVPIVATTEEIYSIGGADGEEWASFTSVTDAVFDANGNLVVVDNPPRSFTSRRGTRRAPGSGFGLGDGRRPIGGVRPRPQVVSGI